MPKLYGGAEEGGVVGGFPNMEAEAEGAAAGEKNVTGAGCCCWLKLKWLIEAGVGVGAEEGVEEAPKSVPNETTEGAL